MRGGHERGAREEIRGCGIKWWVHGMRGQVGMGLSGGGVKRRRVKRRRGQEEEGSRGGVKSRRMGQDEE
jgi:hypothetical protein